MINVAGDNGVGIGTDVTQDQAFFGWLESRIRKVMGEKWLRVLGEVWEV